MTLSFKNGIPSKWAILCLVNLFIASILGVLMRYKILYELPGLVQNHLLHAHSHFVFQGWISLVLFSVLVLFLLPKEVAQKKVYGILFWVMQLSAFGMLFTFLYNGYYSLSIVFSSLTQFAFYWFAIQFMLDLRKTDVHRVAKWFAIGALWCGIISSLGPYALGYYSVSKTSSALSIRTSIYFYLHFQYNGWFLFSIYSIFINWFHKRFFIDKNELKWFFILSALSIIPGYALSIIGYYKTPMVMINSYFSVITQAIAVILFALFIFKNKDKIKSQLTPITRRLWYIAFYSLILKVCMQSLSLSPELANVAFSFRPLVIGYLHLVFICIVSFFLLGFMHQFQSLKVSNSYAAFYGLIAFVLFSLANEFVLFLQAFGFYFEIHIQHVSESLLYISIGMCLGLLLFVIGQFSKKSV
ncbi:MAG: hypothetical protein PHQ74_07465 [Crocinitomicaceae bacterium]|nr:hypothetical protein [Crocinitomicaceae bacterium]